MAEPTFQLLDDRVHFEWTHTCADGSTPTVVLPNAAGEITVLRSDPLTARPRFGCTACGTRGLIHDGRWFDA